MSLDWSPPHPRGDHTAVSVTTRARGISGALATEPTVVQVIMQLSLFQLPVACLHFPVTICLKSSCPHWHSGHFHAEDSKNEFKKNTRLGKGYSQPSVLSLSEVVRGPTYVLQEGRETNPASPKLWGASTLYVSRNPTRKKPERWNFKWIYEDLIVHGF